jgi:RimJ/RimL family protein N-acetyltransferase
MPSLPALTEPLSDGHVVLRPAEDRDIPEILIAYQDDPQLHIRLGERRPPTGAQLGSRSERAAAELAAGTEARLTILEPGSDDCRGLVTLQRIDWDHARGELEIWVAPQARGRGVARRALRLAARWALERCGLERVALLVQPDNEPMLRAARAAGLIEEGLLRSYLADGDRVVLSVVREDLRR